jgi:pullulanase/glycogen debranching enzyme
MIDYFKRLGITALELLPVAHFASEPRLQRLGLSNYWGYNPVAMFALHPAYACSPESALDEFRDAVKALHKAGIEVILDIVLNHSAELDLEGPVSRCAELITVAIIGSGTMVITTTGPVVGTPQSEPSGRCGIRM